MTKRNGTKYSMRWLLMFYDSVLFILVSWVMMFLHPSVEHGYSTREIVINTVLGLVCIIFFRFVWGVYNQIWRFGKEGAVMRLILADFCGFIPWLIFVKLPVWPSPRVIISFSIMAVDLVAAITMRIMYTYTYKYAHMGTKAGAVSRKILKIVGQKEKIRVNGREEEEEGQKSRIRIAIAGAGQLGLSLAEDLLSNSKNIYVPVCFVDKDTAKTGRMLSTLPVYSEEEFTPEFANSLNIQEVVFAMSDIDAATRARLVKHYQAAGCTVKTYDYPTLVSATGGIQLREFSIEELLFRRPIAMSDNQTNAFYSDKVVLVTGGGGSIGSEICRQIAKASPKSIVVVDIYENCAYDLQQEIRMKYAGAVDIHVEIVSVTNTRGLERVFEEYRPQIVIMAAAHKHVPFMEKNCIEAVENNVFGTYNTVLASEKYGVERVIMVSTDKAVNPTNVMGATKRMCEMIVMSHAKYADTKTSFSATRFGNVLGSAGSVIPLFKRQIAEGGPITVTDKRIIRYFMTIPEASQLVLQSGAIAKNGELFVLDMGKPIRIFDLAENMIKLSGLKVGEDIEIIETGLRPGEKLYEELLIQSETLSKTENKLIFIEKDEPISEEDLDDKMMLLERAISRNSDAGVKKVLQSVVPTYVSSVADDKSPDSQMEIDDMAEEMAYSMLSGKRALVVDDIESNRDYASEILREIGLDVDTAANGQEAVNLILSHENGYFSFVLMDIVMPEMDGFETAAKIRENKDFRDLKIIAMTASGEVEPEAKFPSSGMDAFLQKPVHMDDLLRIVTSI